MTRTYTELSKLKTFEERFEYLKLWGKVGEETFGWDRFLNQAIYRSARWKKVRNQIIIRDNGNDLGIEGYPITYKLIVHHMNPIRPAEVELSSELIYDPEFLICVSPRTHEAIHFGDESKLVRDYVERRPNDTCPWKV